MERNYADLSLLYEVIRPKGRTGASLDDAVTNLRKLVKLNSDKGEEYTNQLLYAPVLWQPME